MDLERMYAAEPEDGEEYAELIGTEDCLGFRRAEFHARPSGNQVFSVVGAFEARGDRARRLAAIAGRPNLLILGVWGRPGSCLLLAPGLGGDSVPREAGLRVFSFACREPPYTNLSLRDARAMALAEFAVAIGDEESRRQNALVYADMLADLGEESRAERLRRRWAPL